MVGAQRASGPADGAKPIPPADRDMLGRWKPDEGWDAYIRSYGGRVARLQNRVPDKSQVTLFHAGIDAIARFSASFKDEADLKSVLAKDFSIEPEASLASRALAAAFVVAWRAAQARTREQERLARCGTKPIPD